MNETPVPKPASVKVWIFGVIGALSLAVPLIITPIAWVRRSNANHGHPIFAWALPFYVSSLGPGVVSLIGLLKIRNYGLLWLPLVGITFSAALTLLTLFFWVFGGLNIQ